MESSLIAGIDENGALGNFRNWAEFTLHARHRRRPATYTSTLQYTITG